MLKIGFQLNSVLLACILVVLDSTMTLNFNMLHYCCEEFGVHHEFSTSITPKQHRFVESVLLACILVVLDSTMTLNFNMLHYCCEEFGVHHEFSTSITPKQHRFVKRINYVLVDLGRVMLKCL